MWISFQNPPPATPPPPPPLSIFPTVIIIIVHGWMDIIYFGKLVWTIRVDCGEYNPADTTHVRQFANRTRLIRTPSVPVQPQINRIPFVIDWRAIFFIILLSGTCLWCCPVKPCRFRRRRRRRVIIQRGSCSISQITLLPNRRSAKAPVERFAKLIRFQYRGIFAIDKCV